MKVTSKYKIFGGFGLLFCLNVFLGLVIYIVLSKADVDRFTELNSLAVMGVIFAIQFLFLVLFMTQLRYIIVDSEGITTINPSLPFLRKQESGRNLIITLRSLKCQPAAATQQFG